MKSPPKTSTNETVPLRNVDSQADGLSPTLEARGSKNLIKMITFASDVPGEEPEDIRFNMTVDSLTDNANSNWVEGGEEEGENDGEEDDEEEKEVETDRIEEYEEAEGEELVIEEENRDEEEEEPEEEEDEEEEDHTEEEKILMDYSFPIAKEIKIKSDNDLSKIPSEIYYDRNAMLQILKDLGVERPSLTLRNRYLEFKCFKHLQSIQANGSPPIDDGSNLEDEAERERYMNFLGNYKRDSELFRARENEIKLSLENLKEKLKERWSKDAETYAELTSRETAVAVDLVFATTGRRLTQKRVDYIIHRQTSRRKQVAHERYTFIRQWYMFEEIDAKIRKLETLGPGMKISDYEADFSTKITAKTKIDERNKELQKARVRVCGIMTAITHGKVKLAFLRDEIESKKNRHRQMLESVHKRREELSKMRSQLSITRNRYLKKRETAGLMLALPTLREMERVKELRDAWKQEVDSLRSPIFNRLGTIRKKRPDRKERNTDNEQQPLNS